MVNNELFNVIMAKSLDFNQLLLIKKYIYKRCAL